MFCPICKSEYREGFTKCADCQVDLVEKIEEDEEVDQDGEIDPDIKFVEVLRTSDISDIAIIKSILDGQGFHYFINGDLMLNIRPLDDARLMVAEDEAESVYELLKDVKLNYFQFKYRKR